MHKPSLVSKNYAKALFNIAKESKKIDEIASDLEKFAQNFSSEFILELNNPAISTADLLKVIALVNDKIGISGLAADFLNVVFKNRKISYLNDIHQEFAKLAKEHNNILQIEVISASELTQESLAKIKDAISKKYSEKKIEILQTVKSQILGGIQVKIGSNLIDASIKSQLDQIENELITTIN
jgi:F-type H+-transporting ATPase subunit delta